MKGLNRLRVGETIEHFLIIYSDQEIQKCEWLELE